LINILSFFKFYYKLTTHFLSSNTSRRHVIFYHPQPMSFLPFEQLIGQQMVQFQDSILERLHDHTLSNMLFDGIFETHCSQNVIMFWPRGGHLAYSSNNLPNLSIILFIYFHNTLYATWTTPSFNHKHLLMCVHTSHQPYGYPPFTLCSWQWMHWNSRCNLRHLCHHCTRCWLPCGTKTITCASFNHIQFLLLTNRHYAYQRRHSHLRRRCHCRLNSSIFISLILRNSRICCLRCNSSQRKELLQLTPHWSIPPLSNWSIWLLTQTCQYVSTQLYQCHLELERVIGPL
jgi:hypothetical protein